MNVSFRSYKPEDFTEIRDMLVEAFPRTAELGNWLIDRWSFCRQVSHTMHNTYDTWGETVGVWTDDAGRIVGVVNSEGEERGEAFFQLRHPLPASVLTEMFAFAEAHLACPVDGRQRVLMRIPAGDAIRESIAEARGYTRLGWSDIMSGVPMEALKTGEAPEGFRFRSGDQVTAQEKAAAHAKAFGYYSHSEDRTVPLAFERMKEAPDYRPELDLCLVDETSGEITAFCNVWLDEHNKHGILEPVGTHPGYRRLGLGRAVITEALSRAAKAGAAIAYVGSTQDFYKALGFQPVFSSHVWEKTIEP